MNIFHILSFLFFTLLVAWITWHKTKKDNLSSQKGYFLAGRSLTAPVIAGSLMLTNLSTEQLVGQAGQAYRSNMSVMAWEVISALALVFMALYFLPKYLSRGITTIPEFIEERYDRTTRTIIDICFLVATGICFLPIVLYSGALALNSLFNISNLLDISQGAALWVTIIGLGVVGSIYAVFGGLKAVAISDSINGIGLFIGGIMVPIFGLWVLGSGSVSGGLQFVVSHAPEKLNSMGGSNDPVPFSTIFTGIILVNTFYWCTNQGIVQRTLAAKNLAEGQKGVLFTAILKIFGPIILVFPGIIAFHLYPDLAKADMAYPELVAHVLPKALVGFFGAVLFGAVLSSYNSFLNSASTLFSLGIYQTYIRKEASPEHLVRMGKYFGLALAVTSILIAPTIAGAPQGLFTWMKQLNGVYNVPLVTIIVMGFIFRRVPAFAAKLALAYGITSYILVKYVFSFDIHFLHVLGINCAINVILMLLITRFKPREKAYEFKHNQEVDITPWTYAKPVSVIVILIMFSVYAYLAQFGGYSFAKPFAVFSFLGAFALIIYISVKSKFIKS